MMPIPFKTKCTKTCKRPYCKPCWVKDKNIINKIEFIIVKTIIMSIKIVSINMCRLYIPKEPRYCFLLEVS